MSGNTLMLIGIAMAALGVLLLCVQLAAMKNRGKRVKKASSAADLPAAPVASAPRRAEKPAAAAVADEATVKLSYAADEEKNVKLSSAAENTAASGNEADQTVRLEG
ncbi:MAG: hypothetical protein IJN00_00795 [Clostridia bacterium]|nr:hypothetical protein [Clostridia bacterium]